MKPAPRRLRIAPAGPLIVAGLFLLPSAALPVVSVPAASARPAALRGADEAPGPVARVLVRSGDPAPAGGALIGFFGCAAALGPAGAVTIADPTGDALLRRDGDGAVAVLVHSGDPAPGGGTFAGFCEAAAGTDGTIAFRAVLADSGGGLYRLRPGASAPEAAVVSGTSVPLRSGPAGVVSVGAPAVDGGGGIVLAAELADGSSAILRSDPDGSLRVLLEPGDLLAGLQFAGAAADPSVNATGTVAVAANLHSADGRTLGQTLALLPPGGGPVLLFTSTWGEFATPSSRLLGLTPSINDAGVAAFLWFGSGGSRLQRGSAAGSTTLVADGAPAPGGGTFVDIARHAPVIGPDGAVLFGVQRSDGRTGIYRADPVVSPVLLDPNGAGPGVGGRPVPGGADQRTLAFRGDGGIVISSFSAPPGTGLFLLVDGVFAPLLREGDPIPGARFTFLLETAPSLPAMQPSQAPMGPALAPGGGLIFDARITGGRRGLFTRDPAGMIRALAIDGDVVDGEILDGETLSFHTLDDAGAAAFVAASSAASSGAPAWAVFYRDASGRIRRILRAGDPEPGGNRAIASFDPPSRIDRFGRVVVPATLSDGGEGIYLYDGAGFAPIVRSGDPAPGSGAFLTLRTGMWFGAPIPPVLTDGGRIVFGGTTDQGDSALFAIDARPGGGPAVRLFGEGQAIDGAVLAPFQLRALDADDAGRVLFAAPYNEGGDVGTFLLEDGVFSGLAQRFTFVADLGFVNRVDAALALVDPLQAAFGVQLFSGSAYLSRSIVDGAPAIGAIAATGGASPDGGVYRQMHRLVTGGSRLASDGRGTVAFAATTDAGPDGLFAFGPPPNRPPTASAGADRTVECGGPGGTTVTLDGSASADPEGGALQYRWTGPFGEATGERPEVLMPLGRSVVTLTVDDGGRESAPDSVAITVRDTEPPAIEAVATPSILWPPNGRFVEVGVQVRVADRCDAAPAVILVAASSSEPAGPRRRGSSPIAGAAPGTDDRSVLLQAARDARGPGRTYSLIYRATDASGNEALSTAAIVVPKDRDERRPGH